MNIGKCSGANDELLNDLLGRAYICPRHADAMMFEFGPPPQCIQKQSSEQVKTVYITPYFKKILSEPFPLYSCVVEIETTATNNTHIYIYTYTHIHTYTHTHTYI